SGEPRRATFLGADRTHWCDGRPASDTDRAVDEIQLLMCAPPTGTDPLVSDDRIYRRIDLERPDTVDVAIMLVACYADGACEPWCPPGEAKWARVGLYARFARALDLDELTRRLDEGDLPWFVRKAFVERVRACRAEILRLVDGADVPHRRTWIDPVERGVAR